MDGTNGGFLGGDKGYQKYNLQLARKAFEDDYPISPEVRKLIVTRATLIAGTAKNRRTVLAACKVLLAADNLNIKRQAVAIEDKRNDLIESTTVIREAMKNPAIREAMAQLTDGPHLKEIIHEEGQNGRNGTAH